MNKKLIFIVGPTASGKSEFAVNCAKLLKTDVISCDSMQIYRKMDIGTAKIKENEMQGITHHLIDIVEPNDEFSVAQYKERANELINKMLSDDKIPIICGGTGLYVDSILYPLNFSLSNKDSELRKSLINDYDNLGAKYMHDKLRILDPISASKIHENDKKRLIRALEINLTHGNREKNQLDEPIYDYIMIGFSPQIRDDLYERINLRVDKMFNDGLENEIKYLLSIGCSFENQSMQAIGYKEFKHYFSNEINFDQLKEIIKQHTRNYAKRQITWFKKYNNINWFEKPCQEAYDLIENTFLR